ncbi:MAG: sodium:proton antiporter [Actinobacteria bacterium]|nr:sodium:proton antiporter [Actinomycetota bacterium]
MAVSMAELVLVSILMDWALRRIHIPGLVGMLLVGILFGSYALGWIDNDLLAISADLRMVAMIVILLRAGLELSKKTMARVGVRALLLSFIPATFEGAAIALMGPYFLGLSFMESAILGSVLAAVSPAVVVPLMIRFIEKRMGAEKGIPTLILAASSIDDVFVIVVYSVLIGMYTGSHVSIVWKLAGIPLSIVTGIAIGLAAGWLLYKLFQHFNPRATKRVLILLGVAVLLIRLEEIVQAWVPFSALLAVMAIGFIILDKREHFAHELSAKLGKIWVLAEIILFTMVGAQVNIGVALKTGLQGAALIALALVFRSIGTWVCLLKSEFNLKERLFIVISYIPKATVQAAIGAAPLAAMKLAGMNTQPGEIILAVAVLSILLTAPIGAWAIAITGNRILQVAAPSVHEALDAAIESEAEDSL